MHANTSARVDEHFGGVPRRNLTNPSRPGFRPEHFRPNRSDRLDGAKPLHLDARNTVRSATWMRRQPGGDLELNHHESMSDCRQVPGRRNTIGTATLYGRFATKAVGGVLADQPAGLRVHQRPRRWVPGNRWRMVRNGVRQLYRHRSSISIAVTPAHAVNNPRVNDPIPGPTSATTSSGSICAGRTIRRTVLGSITKFCPCRLVGVSPGQPRGVRPALDRATRKRSRRAIHHHNSPNARCEFS